MSHDFLGTFNRSQFERFIEFARTQLSTIQGRILHLRAEQGRTGKISFGIENDNSFVTVTVTPANSYVAKLLTTYEALGGNPFLDLRVRTKDQAIWIVKPSGDNYAQFTSDNQPLPARGLQDAYSAELIRAIKAPLQGTLDYRFEVLERKIRRAVDLCDQLDAEILRFSILEQAATIEGSLEHIEGQINQLIADTNYRAIYDDSGSDPLGISTYAPFSNFDVIAGEGTRTIQRPQRQGSGYVAPGEEA